MTPKPDHKQHSQLHRHHRAPGRVSGTACMALWAIFLPATIVCAVALGYKAANAERVTLPNLLVWVVGLFLVLAQGTLLVGVTWRYLRQRKPR